MRHNSYLSVVTNPQYLPSNPIHKSKFPAIRSFNTLVRLISPLVKSWIFSISGNMFPAIQYLLNFNLVLQGLHLLAISLDGSSGLKGNQFEIIRLLSSTSRPLSSIGLSSFRHWPGCIISVKFSCVTE